MKLSIIIPVYNEERTIEQILTRVIRAKLQSGIKKEIIVVDDGSTDNSKFKIQNLKLIGLKKVIHDQNRGKGAAVRSGLKVATGEYIIIQDADLEYDPDDYKRLLIPILEKKAEVVYGNRFEDYPLKIWGEDKTILPTHWVGNMILTLVTNLLYGSNLRDMESGYKLFSKKVLDKIDLKARRFEFEPEITAKILKRGYKIIEVPITASPRTYKEGKKIGWKDGVIAIWTLIKYRFVD